jgi:hypothetical protein
MRRLFAVVAALLLSSLALTACGGDSSSGNAADLPTKQVAITITGDTVDPSGEQFDVAIGQRIEFDVTADKPGEIHVHSSPEQEFEYDKGSSTITVAPITAPGRVEVESHTLEKTLFTLQAQ